MNPPSASVRPPRSLTRLAWLSIAAAVVTIGLKLGAWYVTDSVGLLSDAAESVVNLVAAILALIALTWAERPPDEEHVYGHEKAEYLSAGAEGALIVVAAVTILVAAVDRLVHPAAIGSVGIGVAVAAVASAVNLAVGVVLLRAGRDHGSITLEADGRHLLTDVWTSAGVIVGIVAVAATGWERLDPVIALVVATNIVRTGVSLLHRSAGGLLDRALPPEVRAVVDRVLAEEQDAEVRFHAVRTRQAGRRAFVSLHVLVPGEWSVQRGHDRLERVEDRLRAAVPNVTVFTHLEPLEDPVSFADTRLDRQVPGTPPA
jgi:cation diffusion facilitator family transporter